jgi:hypothetical protein
MSIAILTPSRGRPDRLAEMVDAIAATADSPADITVYVGLDSDNFDDYKRALAWGWAAPVGQVVVRPRMHLCPWVNELARFAWEDGHGIVGFMGDDHRPRTRGWDTQVERAMSKMNAGLVYCDDGLQGERLPTAPFWHADVIAELGWFCPPQLTHMFLDNYWKLLADDLGRRAYLPGVLIEHLHPSAIGADGTAKATADGLNAENDSFYPADEMAYRDLVESDHPNILRRVREGLA